MKFILNTAKEIASQVTIRLTFQFRNESDKVIGKMDEQAFEEFKDKVEKFWKFFKSKEHKFMLHLMWQNLQLIFLVKSTVLLLCIKLFFRKNDSLSEKKLSENWKKFANIIHGQGTQ
jgi:hypothetical protein